MDRQGAYLLRVARQRVGISQAELARRAGVAQPVVNAYERGRRQPSVAALARLLRELGVTLQATPIRHPDPDRAGATLVDVLLLADALPTRQKPPLNPGLP